MKLINFLESPQFETLRQNMGASFVKMNSSFTHLALADVLSEVERRDIESRGIDIDSLNILTTGEDGTLIYKNTRVILYIRDWSFQSSKYEQSMPKFHVSRCDTLIKMANNGRSKRYVIASRDDGTFTVNKIQDASVSVLEDVSLEVCKNCLAKLNWGDYQEASYYEKKIIFQKFSIRAFFDRYPKSLLSERDQGYEKSSKLNAYSTDWGVISTKMRESKSWICEECGVNKSNDKVNLHVHHKDGIRSNNSVSNLEVLCLDCHSKKPNHSHLKFK